MATLVSLDTLIEVRTKIQRYDDILPGEMIESRNYYSFDILQSVASPSRNKWRLVFDVTYRRFYFLTDINQNVRYVDLSFFDFSCDTPVEICDMNDPLSGNIQNHFIEYSYDTNYALIAYVADALAPYIEKVPEWAIDSLASYPENTICSSVNDSVPNPFNPPITIRYNLPASGFVTLRIYDLSGREIETLVNENQAAGAHEITWAAEGLPSGIYFYKLKSGEYTETQKLILQK